MHQLEPVRNIFAALFLASIGLIMNPLFLWSHIDILFASLLVVVTAKVLSYFPPSPFHSHGPPILACLPSLHAYPASLTSRTPIPASAHVL